MLYFMNTFVLSPFQALMLPVCDSDRRPAVDLCKLVENPYISEYTDAGTFVDTHLGGSLLWSCKSSERVFLLLTAVRYALWTHWNTPL